MKHTVTSISLALGCYLATSMAAPAGGLVNNTSVGFTPLTELGTGTYRGAQGGLYPGGGNDIPAAHLAAGQALASIIEPLNAAGNPSADGKIGIITTGMSNANQIFDRLGQMLDGLWADKVVFVNAAQGGMDARLWADRESTAWNVALGKVSDAGLTTKQIQLALNYHAVAHINTPPQPWPATPGDLQAFLETIAGHLATTFPNLRLSFWGTREYGGYATSANNPEPYAYQSGFAVKWMIERQINKVGLNFDPEQGAVTAPWMAWGPYTWADGIRPRADGLFYEPRDFRRDGTHPSMRGRSKIAWTWVEFLRNQPLTAARLFPAGNRSPVCAISFPQDAEAVAVGSKVAIEAFAADEDSGIERVDFYHGTTLIGSDSAAPFSILWTHPGPGDYPLHVVARDAQGGERTSRIITAKLRASGTASDIIAEDSFESGDFRGGSGWNGEWIVNGNPLTLSGQAEDGKRENRQPPTG
ncbi:MAG: Ig-like domain-containing protein [Akkermansiaceae bacterium]|nr:Ig-like domain-containing protein [Akkermansiaceae bacterium]